MRILAASILTLMTACTPSENPSEAPPPSDTLLVHGGIVWAGAGQKPTSDFAILVRNGRIDFVGPIADARARAQQSRELDVSGMTVLPGLIDAHAHIDGLAIALDTLDLTGTTSLDDVVSRVAKRAAETPKGTWITGRGWDQNDWPEKEFPTVELLDSVAPDHPVYLRRVDGHAAYVNSAALRSAGVTASTQHPAGGRILRDAQGNPSGVFIDNAMDLVAKSIPPPSRDLRKKRLQRALENVASQGLIAVHEAGSDDPRELIEIYKELIDHGAMPIRVYYMLPNDDALLGEWFANGPLVDYGNKLTIRSVKLYADGALGSRGAALLAPYSDEPSSKGLLVMEAGKINDVATRAAIAGFQVGTHAIGDRGVHIVLDAYAKAQATPEDRFRIEHFQVASLDDIERLASLGVIASMQPTHATSDMPWAEARIGAERVKGAYAWRNVLNAGGRLALGSDFPVEDVNPFFGIHAAVTRQDHGGNPPGGWRPEEKLTLAEAVKGFTIDAAYAALEDESRGTIEAGKWADLTIVDGDFARAPASEIWKTKVRYTIASGEVVYRAGR